MERSGAAQGLAEVLGVLGPEYLAGLLPDILATCAAKAAVAREGSLTLFKYLPLAMPDECQVGHPWLRAVPPAHCTGGLSAVKLLAATRLMRCAVGLLTKQTVRCSRVTLAPRPGGPLHMNKQR